MSAGRIAVFAGSASLSLGAAVCGALDLGPGRYTRRTFPDGESEVELQQSVRGHDVYLVQSTSPPVAEQLMHLLFLADACRRAGADRLTAVIPYFGYARQDRRPDRRSFGARVAASVVGTAHLDRVMLIDAHTPAIEGFFDVPLDHLTAVPLLAAAAAPRIRTDTVVVAPDFGAVKRARAYAAHLGVPMAFIHKSRLSGEAVEAHTVIGEVRGRLPLIVDDMLSTGATIEAAVAALRAAGAREPAAVAVTHALLVGRSRETLDRLSLAAVHVTDTVAIAPADAARVELTSVAPLIASAIHRHHHDESLTELRAPD